jgi:hypothetical protein
VHPASIEIAPATLRRPSGPAELAAAAVLPSPVRLDPRRARARPAATGLSPLDTLLEGGFPAGAISELVGPRSSGRMRVLLGVLATVTRQGALAALVDVADGFDPASAAALGVSLERVLWVRCGGRLGTAWPAADVLTRAGSFGAIVVDQGDLPPVALARTPAATFVRLQRAVERGAGVLLLAGRQRVAGSLATVAVALGPAGIRWAAGGPGLLAGWSAEVRLLRSRTRAPGASVRLAWGPLDAAAGPPPPRSRPGEARRPAAPRAPGTGTPRTAGR